MLIGQIFYSTFATAGNVLLDQEKIQQKLADIKPWEVIHWSTNPGQIYENRFMVIPLRLQTEMDFTLYADKLEFYPPSGMSVAKVIAPATVRKKDPLSSGHADVYTGGDFELVIALPESSRAKLGNNEKVKFAVRYLGCTEGICLLPHTYELESTISKIAKNYTIPNSGSQNVALGLPQNGDVEVFSYDNKDERDEPNAIAQNSENTNSIIGDQQVTQIQSPISADQDKNLETRIAERLKGNIPFWMILGLLFIGGVLTNLTPCVYPMIPITIRVLSNQSSSTILASILYGAGILLTYTSLGIIAAYSGILFGSFMASPSLNLLLAAIMFVFAFSMLGFGNFGWLQNIGNRLAGKGKGAKNALFMGLGAGLVASPCTGPILASLLAVTSTRNNVFEASLLLATYSLGFALPYVFLGVLSNKIAKKRFSPRIQVAVKTLFAGAIFSVAFIYLKIPLQSTWHSIIPSLEMIAQISGYVAILLVILITLARDLFERKALLIFPAFMCGIALFAAFELRFNQNPNPTLTWIKEEESAFKIAEAENRPILVDAWAEWCVACKKMEIETFTDPKVIQEIQAGRWVLLKLDLTESNELTDELQSRYGIQSLPTLIVIPQGGKPSFENRKLLVGYQDVGSLLDALVSQRGT